MTELSQDFINIFAAYDNATKYDYYRDLKNNVSVIIAATCQADGKTEERETAKDCLIIDILAEISKRLNSRF